MKLDDDVAAAIEQLRERERLGFSEALNRLARIGLATGEPARRSLTFEPMTFDTGVMADVSNVAEALEYAELNDDR